MTTHRRCLFGLLLMLTVSLAQAHGPRGGYRHGWGYDPWFGPMVVGTIYYAAPVDEHTLRIYDTLDHALADLHPDEHARQQHALGVRHGSANGHGAGSLIDLRLGASAGADAATEGA